MQLLIVASTPFEFYDLKSYYESYPSEFLNKNIQLEFLVCGVGVVPTVYHLLSHLRSIDNTYDGIIQMGIAGSFREKYKVGEIVHVISEAFGDTGAEENDGEVLDLFDLNLWEKNQSPFDNKLLFCSENFPVNIPLSLANVHGLTVGLGSGQKDTIAYRKKKFAADIESMEGAAFFYVCTLEKKPFRQIRSISNAIIPRDTQQWQVKRAIENLNNYMKALLLNELM